MNKLRAVIALGSKALQISEGSAPESSKPTFSQIGAIIANLSQKYELIIVHGSTHQLEDLLTRSETSAKSHTAATTLDTSIAMAQGQIGYLLAQSIDNALAKIKRRKKVASLITQVIVDRHDPAFRHPSKFIGPAYTAKESLRFTKLKGWEMRDDGCGYRRVVPSPAPVDIVEKQSILSLVDAGAVVIAAGGGGIPVTRTKVLKILKGVEAVVDADFTAERIAEIVKADIFAVVTDVPNVYLNYKKPDQISLGFISPAELDSYVKQGQFTQNTMLPKVQAVAQFAAKHKVGVITSLDRLEAALARRAGTVIQ